MDLEKLDKLRGLTRDRPKYEVIKQFLLEEFTSGNYETGQPLPSENTLVEMLGVARNTVRQAVHELEKEGLVKRVRGKGSYFTGKTNNSSMQQLEVFSLILPEISRGLYPILAKGFDYQASITHQQVMLCNTDYDINKQGNIILQMIEKNVAGVTLVPALSPPTPTYHVTQLQRHEIPVVFCHRRVPEAAAPLISWDWKAAASLAGKTFLDHGHKKIAYFARYRYALTESYEKGLREVMDEYSCELHEHHIFYGNTLRYSNGEKESRIKALKTMLQGTDPVTAIFCNDDNEAELVYYLLTELGMSIPGDISIIGFGDCHARHGVFQSRLTSVTVNEFDLGARAARVLYEMRTGQRPIDSEEIIYKPLSLIEGDTLATH